MKSFGISVVILSIMILLTVCDIFYCAGVTGVLEKTLMPMADADGTLPERAELDALIGYWEKHEPLIRLSTDTRYTERITEKLYYLRDAAAEGNVFEVRSTVSGLLRYTEELRRANGVSLENIL